MKIPHKLVLTTALAFGIMGGFSQAYAACSSPAGSKGEQIYNDDYNVMQFCNGTQWVAMAGSSGVTGDGSAQFTAQGGDIFMTSGNFGLGTSTPTAGLQLGDGTDDISTILLARPDSSTNLDIYSSYDGGNNFGSLTGAFAYGVLPGSNKFSIRELGTNVAWAELFGLSPSGNATLAGNFTAGGNLAGVNGTLSGTLNVTGASTLGVINAGATAVAAFSTSDLATLHSTTVTNNATIGGTLGVTGTSTLGALNAGASTLDSLTVTNNATITGNLGVGTAPSSAKLHVAGNVTLDNNSTIGWLNGSAVQTQIFGLNSFNNLWFRNVPGDYLFDLDTTASDFSIREDGNTVIFTVKESGNVGIGTTNPSHALDVNGTVRATAFIGDGAGITNVANADSATNAVSAGDADRLDGLDSLQFLRSDADDTMTGSLDISDRLAVGGASTLLRTGVFYGDAVTSGDHEVLGVWSANGNESLYLGYGANGTIHTKAFLRSNNSLPLHLGTAGSGDALRIINNGDVGIGKNPTSKLDVAGTVTASGFVGDGSGLTGVAAAGGDSATLDGLDSAQFLRSDVNDTMDGQLTFNRATGANLLSWPGGGNNILRRITDQGGFTFGADSSSVIHAGDNTASLPGEIGILPSTTGESLYLTADSFVQIVTARQAGAYPANTHEFTFGTNGVLTAPSFAGNGSGLTGVTASGVPADSLDWDDISDTMTLDATTAVTMGSNDLNFDAGTLFIDGSANSVGIGTTTPSNELEIVDSSGNVALKLLGGFSGGTSTILLDTVGDGSEGRLTFQKSGVSNGVVKMTHGATAATTELTLDAGGGAGEMVIESTGNVGIGKNNPGTKLDVNGTVTATAFVGDASGMTNVPGDNLGAGGTTTGTLYAKDGTGYGYLGTDGSNYFRFDDATAGNEVFLRLGGDWRYHFSTARFSPYSDNAIDLGNSTLRWQDIFGVRVRGDSGFYWNTTNYLDDVTGQYGSMQVNGAGAGGWEGLSIDGRAVFMHDGGNATGIYNDVNNQWLFYAIHGGAADIRHAGAVKLVTRPDGVQVTGSLYLSSDRTLKEDIQPIHGALDKIDSIRGVTYHWKEDNGKGMDTQTLQSGVIAQEVEAVFPHLVTGEDGDKTVNYDGLVGPLIQAVKELKAMNEAQQVQISAQQLQIQTLSAEVEVLKKNKGVLLKASSQ